MRPVLPSVIVFMLFAAGCGAAPTHNPKLLQATPTAPATQLPATTWTVVPHRALTSSPTASPAPVSITAVGGNLFIRRGPHIAFNPVAVLYEGEQAQAIGRDMLAHWVQVLPTGSSQSTGWISVQTRFSVVHGNLDQLPVMETTDWPEAAYLRNCTHHEMQVEPGGLQLPSSLEAPDNEIRVYPGTYMIIDIEVFGEPDVARVTVREGDLVEIREDGSGERRKCPVE